MILLKLFQMILYKAQNELGTSSPKLSSSLTKWAPLVEAILVYLGIVIATPPNLNPTRPMFLKSQNYPFSSFSSSFSPHHLPLQALHFPLQIISKFFKLKLLSSSHNLQVSSSSFSIYFSSISLFLCAMLLPLLLS